jgi:imidazolonepropionase-like amidohydrolase
MTRHFARCAVLLLVGLSTAVAFGQMAIPPKGDVLIKNATLLTVTHGRVEHGSVYVKDGKIAAFGATVNAPAGVTVIDAGGKYVTPGIIDSRWPEE